MRQFRTMAGTVVCITKTTKKTLIGLLRNFKEHSGALAGRKVSISYKNGRFMSFISSTIEEEKISFSMIKSIVYFDGEQYFYYGAFFIQPNGEIISSLEESTGNGEEIKGEVAEDVNSEIPPQIVTKKEKQYKYGSRRALSRKMPRPSRKDQIIENVDFYLTKGRFYYQIDKKLYCEALQDQLDSIKKEMDEELYEILMEEIQEIKDGTDMVRYYDRGDEKWTTNTIVRKAIAEFTDRFVEDSFLSEFDYMCKTSDFWEIYDWIDKNYNIDILTLVGGEKKDEGIAD